MSTISELLENRTTDKIVVVDGSNDRIALMQCLVPSLKKWDIKNNTALIVNIDEAWSVSLPPESLNTRIDPDMVDQYTHLDDILSEVDIEKLDPDMCLVLCAFGSTLAIMSIPEGKVQKESPLENVLLDYDDTVCRAIARAILSGSDHNTRSVIVQRGDEVTTQSVNPMTIAHHLDEDVVRKEVVFVRDGLPTIRFRSSTDVGDVN